MPVDPRRGAGYGGRGTTFPFGANVVDVPAAEIAKESIDCILFQTRQNWERDQHEILSPVQRRLPRIHLQHDPPWNEPTEERHWSDDPGEMLNASRDDQRSCVTAGLSGRGGWRRAERLRQNDAPIAAVTIPSATSSASGRSASIRLWGRADRGSPAVSGNG
ncbi:MAG TPA: hypothetical protein VGI99_09490 [Gemmataceae bacterium]